MADEKGIIRKFARIYRNLNVGVNDLEKERGMSLEIWLNNYGTCLSSRRPCRFYSMS